MLPDDERVAIGSDANAAESIATEAHCAGGPFSGRDVHIKCLHLHVAVENLQHSIYFYSGLFSAEPTVVKADNAKWTLDDPRVNFAISQRGTEVGLNHLGMQVELAEEHAGMHARLAPLQADLIAETGADVRARFPVSAVPGTIPQLLPWA